MIAWSQTNSLDKGMSTVIQHPLDNYNCLCMHGHSFPNTSTLRTTIWVGHFQSSITLTSRIRDPNGPMAVIHKSYHTAQHAQWQVESIMITIWLRWLFLFVGNIAVQWFAEVWELHKRPSGIQQIYTTDNNPHTYMAARVFSGRLHVILWKNVSCQHLLVTAVDKKMILNNIFDTYHRLSKNALIKIDYVICNGWNIILLHEPLSILTR